LLLLLLLLLRFGGRGAPFLELVIKQIEMNEKSSVVDFASII
jgi:hypothetical protein